MFVRKKRNRSGSTSVVVVSKSRGRFVEVKNFGMSPSDVEIANLCNEAQRWLSTRGGQLEIDFDNELGKEAEETRRVVDNMDAVLINGIQLLLSRAYDSIGFGMIKDETLRHLVTARVSQPNSKMATVEYLKSYYEEDVDLNRIYRYMDKLYNSQMETAQRISVEHTRKALGGKVGLMFYDAYNRQRGVARLRKAYASGKLSKSHVNKRGYNKFLEISKDVDVSINEDKIEEDCRWAGLKGYLTNTDLDATSVVSEYHGLWVVERAFRVSKGTLNMRPMFHFTERRIEAHMCICFIAYKVYKELERIVKSAVIDLSVDKVLSIARTITTVRVKMPKNGQTYTKTLFLTDKHRAIKPLFDLLEPTS